MLKNRISIIGSGWVGTAVGKGFAEKGYEVIFYDIVDKYLPNFTSDLNHAIENSEVSFICVPEEHRGANNDRTGSDTNPGAIHKEESRRIRCVHESRIFNRDFW
jgi:UDP-glucose 6-dehydrogenase